MAVSRRGTTVQIILAVALALALMFSAVAASEAEAEEVGTMTTLISSYGVQIDQIYWRQLQLYGYTDGMQTLDYIEVKLTLQRWNGSQWVNLASETKGRYNHWWVDHTFDEHVDGPGWYRTRGDHFGQKGWTGHSETIFSGSLWVD